jgi:hypothetical protein
MASLLIVPDAAQLQMHTPRRRRICPGMEAGGMGGGHAVTQQGKRILL